MNKISIKVNNNLNYISGEKMISLCIKTNNKKAIEFLKNNINRINLDNIYFSDINFSKFNNFIIHYKGSFDSIFYNNLADIIVDLIISIYEPQIIRNLIFSDYFYFDNLDMNSIYKSCLNTLNSDEYSERKQTLWISVLKYLTNNKSIYLYGFINFRIKEYLKYLNNAIDNCVNQFVISKEYSNFIDLVQTYINTNIPNTETLHLIYYNNEKAILLDKDKNIINPIEKNLNYLSDISFSSNDYTLNTILSLLPEELIIHIFSKEDEFINTLKLIFGNKIKICYGCELCSLYKNKLTSI